MHTHPAPTPQPPARFDSKRIFFQSSIDGNNTGWYITINSERAYGPFPQKDVAQEILNGLIKRLRDRQSGDAGNPDGSRHVA